MLICLSPKTKTARFQRSVRDEKGGLVKTLVFESRQPVEIVDHDDAKAIENDIGQTLVLCRLVPADEKFPDGPTKTVIDVPGTELLVVSIAAAKLEKKKPLSRYQKAVYEEWSSREHVAPSGEESATAAPAESVLVDEQLADSDSPGEVEAMPPHKAESADSTLPVEVQIEELESELLAIDEQLQEKPKDKGLKSRRSEVLKELESLRQIA